MNRDPKTPKASGSELKKYREAYGRTKPKKSSNLPQCDEVFLTSLGWLAYAPDGEFEDAHEAWDELSVWQGDATVSPSKVKS